MSSAPMTFPQMEAALELAAAQFLPIQQAMQSLSFFNRRLYVDPVSGVDTNNGTAFATAFKTMAHAIEVCDVYDIIGFVGTIKEDSLTLATPNVTILGLGANPVSNVWQQSDTYAVSKILLTVTAANCAVVNTKIRPAAYLASGVPAGIALAGAHQFQLLHSLMQGRAGSYFGLYSDGNNANVKIKDTVFAYINTLTYGIAIGGHGYSVGENSGWSIEDCLFHSNVNHIVMRMRQSTIKGGIFSHYGLAADGSELATTKKIDISGAVHGWNHVTDNTLCGAYTNTGGYTPGTNDNWAGNRSSENGGTYVSVGGLTLTIPQAA